VGPPGSLPRISPVCSSPADIGFSEVVTDPETCNPNHFVQDGLASRDQTPCFGFGKHSEEAGYLKAPVHGDAAATRLIDQQQIGRQLTGDNNGFGFAGIELLAEHVNLVKSSRSTAGGTTISAWRSRSRWSLFTAEMLRIGEVPETTLGQAAILAGLPQLDFQRLPASRQIPLHYGLEAMEQDLQRAKRLSGG